MITASLSCLTRVMIGKRLLADLPRRGLFQKTAFTIAWMAVLAGVFSIALTMAVTRDRAEENASRELGELLDTVESTVRIACFVEDQTLAAEVVRGMLRNSKVLRVEIHAGGRELAHSDRFAEQAAQTRPIPQAAAYVAERRLIRRVSSPFNAQQIVGEIALDPDPAAISRSVAGDVQFVSLLLGVQWVALGGGLLLLIVLSVVRPIKMISDSLHRMDAESGEQLMPPRGLEKTEIGRLVVDINELARRLVAAIRQATEQTRLLHDAKEQVDGQKRQLEEKNTELARAMRVQEEVERIARHDLKTPLNSIAAIPELLRRHRQPDKDEEALLAIVERSAKRVLRMVSLSLDLYRMEVGRYAFRPQALDLAAQVLAVTQDLAKEAEAKALDFRIARDDFPLLVRGEETLCYSILANLLKNAVEAAPPGSPVRISLAAGDPVRLRVHNEGAVPVPIRASFFEKYTTYGKSDGTGLGSYSARLMARVQGGELTMDSADDSGTTLTLELQPMPQQGLAGETPLAPRAALPVVLGADAIPALRILLADDDPDNLLIMKLFLPSPQLVVETASNGREALEACRRQRPDVIFMDIEMPVMDGFEALQRIRTLQAERGEAASRIVAFSAHDDEASQRCCGAAGFDLYLSKPSSQNEILELLRGKTGRGGRTAAVSTALPDAVVCVDDDLFDAIPGFLESRRTLATALRHALAAQECEQLRQLAHKLKGSLGLYGFDWAARICGDLEYHYSSADPKAQGARIDALEQHLAQVKICRRTRVCAASH